MDSKATHFLLVEDNEDHAELVTRSLERNNLLYFVHHVEDGQAALDYLTGRHDAPCQRPDVIFLDLNLPKLSGRELLAILKTDDDLRLIPVVILTTSASESDRSEAYLLHANSYLVKPVDFAQFRTLIGDASTYWGKWNRGA